MLFARNRLASTDFSIRIFDCSIRVASYIDALSMLHGISIGGLSPNPLVPGFADLEYYALKYYNVHPRCYYNIANGALIIKQLYQ